MCLGWTSLSPFSALTLLVGQCEWHPVCKYAGCWFAGGNNLPGASFANLTAPAVTTTSIMLNSDKNPDWIHPGTSLPRLSWKFAIKCVLLHGINVILLEFVELLNASEVAISILGSKHYKEIQELAERLPESAADTECWESACENIITKGNLAKVSTCSLTINNQLRVF